MSSVPVLAFGIVSEETDKAVELLVRREDAERFLEDVRADEPPLVKQLRLEPVELDGASA
jgi:hypothetical protein